MTIEGKCVYCGWLVAVYGTYEPACNVRPDEARKYRCDNSACVCGAVRKLRTVAWAATAERGDYLARYVDGENDPGSRCGYSDSALDEIRRALVTRGLTLRADDMGLVVEVRE